MISLVVCQTLQAGGWVGWDELAGPLGWHHVRDTREKEAGAVGKSNQSHEGELSYVAICRTAEWQPPVYLARCVWRHRNWSHQLLRRTN